MAYPDLLHADVDNHRLYEYLYTIAIYTASLDAAVRSMPPDEPAYATIRCSLYPKEIVVPLQHVFRRAFLNAEPASIEFGIRDAWAWDSNLPRTEGLNRLSRSVHHALFMLHIEPWLDWIKVNVSTDYHRWPPVANFCRVVRNAIVHGGRINIASPKAPVVSWESLAYSYENLDRQILDTDISFGDLMVLAFAFNDELDGLKAPLTLP